jgi:HD-like signal output (HDOD) protein
VISILFIDDDPEIISSTKRLLHAQRQKWSVTLAASGAEALQRLATEEYDVIVSDIRMPGMSGMDLLQYVRAHFPKMVRIALSGHADRNTSLLVSGLAHQYLAKPCDMETILGAIQQALFTGSLVPDENLRALISHLQTVPSQPEAYLQIVAELKKEAPSIGTVGKIIARDASMSAKILQLVNSAFFGLPQTVIDPTQASVLLGLDTVRDLVLTIGIFSQFDVGRLTRLSLGNIWDHSQRTGGLAKAIAQTQSADKKQISDAYIAGLLHDVGKLILADNLPQQYFAANQRATLEQAEISKVEKEIFGATHAQVGAYLFGLWGLPPGVVSAVAGHHEPMTMITVESPVVLAVHVANVMDYQVHPEQIKVGRAPTYDEIFLQARGVNPYLSDWQQRAF